LTSCSHGPVTVPRIIDTQMELSYSFPPKCKLFAPGKNTLNVAPERSFDLEMKSQIFFINGRVVNVYSGEILPHNVAVSAEKISYVGPSKDLIGPETRVIDTKGSFILPGFFDAHAHADLFYHPFSYADHVVSKGTTCFFNDGHDLANAIGATAYLKTMNQLTNGFLSAYTGIPAAAPPYPEVEGGDLWSDEDLEKAYAFDNVLSLSEITPYLRLINGEPALKNRIRAARENGRLVEGHTTGANWDKLNVLSMAGVTSCHESLKAEDAMERLRLGYYVMLRHGSIRQDLPYLAEAVHRSTVFDTSRIMLVTDGIFPDHLISWGNMDWVVAEAVNQGIDPVRAIQMATINPARYFRLDHLLGGIAPGRLAHLLVVDSLEKPTPRLVLSKGAITAENGVLSVSPFPTPKPDMGNRPFNMGPLSAETFQVVHRKSLEKVPVIKIVNQTVTTLGEVRLRDQNGVYQPEGDILTATLISRDGAMKGQGFVQGFCSGLSGLASTVAHETHGLLVVGQRAADMARAAEDVLKMGGGISMVRDGIVLARVPLPVGGVCSRKSVPDLAQEITTFHGLLADSGCTLTYPLWTLGFLTFTSVLKVRLTYQGVYDVKAEKIIF
jgi:adenine deaminase